MADTISDLILQKTRLRLGINKLNELSRLVFEINRREGVLPEALLEEQPIADTLADPCLGYLDKFSRVKGYLLRRRYPNACGQEDFSVYFSRLSPVKTADKAESSRRSFQPEAIYIEKAVKDSALVRNVIKLFPGVQAEYIDNLKEFRAARPASPYDLRKRELVISRQLWDFVKACPCTKEVVCCNYHVINLGFGCPFDCSYCYLQHYTNCQGIILDANIEDFITRIDSYLESQGGRTIRIGTGEFTDSLALDHITEYSKALVPFFASRDVLFELKTKSANIDNLPGLEHKGRTVVSWSLNPRRIVETEELGTASLDERFAAARACSEAGYKIGFHFDPILYYEGWEKEYSSVVNELFDTVKHAEWISLGTLRFHRSLKQAVEHRFPESNYIYGEMVIGQDKKMRYYSALRRDIYQKMAEWIRRRSPETSVYLCMEPKEMWQQSLGHACPAWRKE